MKTKNLSKILSAVMCIILIACTVSSCTKQSLTLNTPTESSSDSSSKASTETSSKSSSESSLESSLESSSEATDSTLGEALESTSDKTSEDISSETFGETSSETFEEASTESSADASEETTSSESSAEATTETVGETTTEAESTAETEPPQVEDKYYTVTNYDDFKAVWLSQFDLNGIFVKSGEQRDQSEYTDLMGKLLDKVKATGFNTVFIQLRPNADSFYPSEFYPPSIYVAGAYGNDFSYDAMPIFMSLARARGLSVHAWINPMRAMSDTNIKLISDKYTIKKWYNNSSFNGKYIVKVNNFWYLNPAYPEVRELIINGAREAMVKYEFDGLHMDDYFYPTQDTSFDSAAYTAYTGNGGTMSLADWRRNNVNILVKGLYDMTKEINPNAWYGISPAGNQLNVYDVLYADYKTWCATAGYIDYICPQVYFGLEHATFDFVKVSKDWQAAIKTDSVKLIIGLTLDKAQTEYDQYAGSGQYEWRDNKDVIKRSLLETEKLERCVGVAFFCYQHFYDPLTGAEVSKTQAERDNFVPYFKTMSWK